MLARRRPLAALREPLYDMASVPRFCAATADCSDGSVVQRCGRPELIASIAELLLLCNEALERHKSRNDPARRRVGLKPLSIEYIADRLATDDPIWGYLVRERRRGWLQGFITLTTFTTFVRNFKWDSLHEQAEILDNKGRPFEGQDGSMLDLDGTLSAALQREVRSGDVHDCGVVWPHVAELSLLGGLGAGGWLVDLVLDELECRPAAEMQYKWLVLEATDNSVSFYQSKGFIRVGAVASHVESNGESKALRDEGSAAERDGFERSATGWHYTAGGGGGSAAEGAETPITIAAASRGRFSAADVIFLNKAVYPELCAETALPPGAQLRVPIDETDDGMGADDTCSVVEQLALRRAALYYCRENDRPRDIADECGVMVSDLVRLNKRWYEGLTASASLMEGTILRLPHKRRRPPLGGKPLHVQLDCEDERLTYRHWTFANEAIEFKEGSKMMVRRLISRPRPAPFAAKGEVEGESKSEAESAAASATEASVGGAAPHPLPLRESPLLQLSRLMIDAPMIPTPSLKLAPLNESDLEYGSGSRRRARRHPVYIRLRMDPRTWPARAAVLAGREVKQLRVRVHPPTAKELPRHVVGDKDKDAVDDTDEGDRREMAAAAAGAASVERRARRARARDALVVRDAPTAPFGTFRVIVGGDAGDDIVVGGVAKSAACAPRCAESRAEIPAAPVGDKRKRDGAARNGATLFANVPALCRGINTRLRVRLKGAHLCWGGISADLARATTRVRAMATALPRAPRVRVVFPKGAKGRGFWPPLVANLPPPPPKRSLVNRIVRVRPLVRIDGAARPEDDRRWKYYFTMTYIPDLEWCFLAPLEECGTFGADFGLAVKGRTRWKTVPEGKGRELHLSARRCTLVTANSVVKSKDADAEEWDIREPSF